MSTEEPIIGRIYPAVTLTEREDRVRVEVTAVDRFVDGEGWIVWGYRQYPTRARRARQTMYPRQYAIR